jgi:beta-glucosidase-like glycosyl hydrolase
VFCDPTKDIASRTKELLSKMTLQEKVAQTGSNGVPSIARLGIPKFQWWGEALHGVCKSPSVSFGGDTPNGTSFPEIIGVGSTFNPELFASVGEVVGSEARVMMNLGRAGGTFWAPNINIVKDPRYSAPPVKTPP